MDLYLKIKKESDLAKREAMLGRRDAHHKKFENDFDMYDAYEKQFRDFGNELGTKQVEASKEFLKPVGKDRVPPAEIFIDEVGNPVMGPVDWMNPMQKKSFDSTLSKQFGEEPAPAGMRWDHIRMLLQRQAEEAAKKGGQ